MKVFCPAGAAVVRCFVGNLCGPSTLVLPDQGELPLPPDLSRYGIKGYDLAGIVVVRQAGYIELDIKEQANVLVVRPGQVSFYKRPCPLKSGVFEGLLAAPHNQAHLLGL